MSEKTLTQRMQDRIGETSHTISSTPQRLLDASRGALNMTREEADQWMERGENLFAKLVERGEKIEGEQVGRWEHWRKAWGNRSREQFHQAEEQIEQQVRQILEALHIPSADEVTRLDQRLDHISKKLDLYLMQAEGIELPIEGYGEMTVKQIVPLLDGLDEQELRAVQTFEMANANRKTVLREIEHKLEAMALAPEVEA